MKGGQPVYVVMDWQDILPKKQQVGCAAIHAHAAGGCWVTGCDGLAGHPAQEAAGGCFAWYLSSGMPADTVHAWRWDLQGTLYKQQQVGAAVFRAATCAAWERRHMRLRAAPSSPLCRTPLCSPHRVPPCCPPAAGGLESWTSACLRTFSRAAAAAETQARSFTRAQVSWEFWTNSNDQCGPVCDVQKDFIKEFVPVAKVSIV